MQALKISSTLCVTSVIPAKRAMCRLFIKMRIGTCLFCLCLKVLVLNLCLRYVLYSKFHCFPRCYYLLIFVEILRVTLFVLLRTKLKLTVACVVLNFQPTTDFIFGVSK